MEQGFKTNSSTVMNPTNKKAEEKLSLALKLKEEGNEFYQQKEIKKAIRCYHRYKPNV